MHPGWPPVQGWPRVKASWELIFRNTPFIQFLCTSEQVFREGPAGWVILEENILQAAGSARVARTSRSFGARGRGRERVRARRRAVAHVVHHGALVGADERPADPDRPAVGGRRRGGLQPATFRHVVTAHVAGAAGRPPRRLP